MEEGQDVKEETWHLTIVRAQGLRLMRPEKSWRPIVTLEVDRHHCHETVLGVDGQNPNLKEVFRFHEPNLSTRVEIKVWHRGQSKKKGRKRSLVGCAAHSLGELAKRGEDGKLDLRLTCQPSSSSKTKNTRSQNSPRGKPQNGAVLVLRVRAPATGGGPPPPPGTADSGYGTAVMSSSAPFCSHSRSSSVTSSSSSSSSASSSSASSSSSTPEPPEPEPEPQEEKEKEKEQEQLLRRRLRPNRPRKVVPYVLDSDCASSGSRAGSGSEEEEEEEGFWDDEEKALLPDAGYFSDLDPDSDSDVILLPRPTSHPLSWGWLSASLLPTYAETIKLSPPPPLNRWERAIASVTFYAELKDACAESHFEKVFGRVVVEWTFMGGLLVALAAVDTAVFSISPGSIFEVSPMARNAIAASSIASGLGIACDAWFLFRYGWVDLRCFMSRALDIFSTYLFFSLSSRVPALCMLISATSLMGFLAIVAYAAFPMGVLVVCFLVGVVMSLQFLAYGVVKAVEGGRRCVQEGRRGVRVVGRRLTGGGERVS